LGVGSYEDEIWETNVTEMDWETVTCQEVCPQIRVGLIEREVEARLAAVEEIKESTNYKLEDVASLLTRLPDLEKGLVRIHYGRVTYLHIRFADVVFSS
jgi:hypothetical protein